MTINTFVINIVLQRSFLFHSNLITSYTIVLITAINLLKYYKLIQVYILPWLFHLLHLLIIAKTAKKCANSTSLHTDDYFETEYHVIWKNEKMNESKITKTKKSVVPFSSLFRFRFSFRFVSRRENFEF